MSKCIIIEDSRKQILGPYARASAVVRCRNPWLQDPAIDYEMDSEDELAEEQGEDLNSRQARSHDSEEEEDLSRQSGEEEPGFIVSDGHLSVSEYNFSQEEHVSPEEQLREISRRRERLRSQQQSQSDVGKVYVQTGGLGSFAVVALGGRALPVAVQKPPKEAEKGDPNAILAHRAELLRLIHASAESKQGVIDQMHARHPDCSKKSIERVFREVTVKEKRGQDVRAVYYATEEVLGEIGADGGLRAELAALAQERMAPLLLEVQREEERIAAEREEKEARRQEARALQEQAERERLAEREKARQEREAERVAKEAAREREKEAREAEREARERAKAAEAAEK